MFHILLSSDSLSLPRPWLKAVEPKVPNNFTGFTESYPFRLEEALLGTAQIGKVKVTNWGSRASGLSAVVKQSIDLFSWMQPDLTIIHRGLVNCWPRDEKNGAPNTSLEEFEGICREAFKAREKLNPDLPIFLVGICPTNTSILAKFPQTNERIRAYNNVFKRALTPIDRYLDMEELHDRYGEQLLHEDGHHLSHFGHQILADRLVEEVMSYFAGDRRLFSEVEPESIVSEFETPSELPSEAKYSPLYIIPGPQAVANRKDNSYARWPSRSDPDNRVEPIAKPAFDIPFQLIPGEKVFTIGSCFARNIEQELEERGFEVPARQLLKRADLKLSTDGLLNNYGVTSILQELVWAFDSSRPFDTSKGFVEVSRGRYVDLHLPSGLKPEPLELVDRRRQAIIECTRELASCRAVILTLGLAEVWFDSHAQQYLNESPRPSFVRGQPDRFELHVLDYAFTHNCLKEALELIRANGPIGVQVLLSVSPVPLNATHRKCDVMAANTYSKSVLRSIAEAVVSEYDFVHYFPSYENVVLSDRRIAWKEDQVHVTPELTKFNVTRMLAACTKAGAKPTPEYVLETLKKLKAEGIRPQWYYLNENLEVVRDSPDLAYVFARLAINRQDLVAAKWAVESLPDLQAPFRKEFLTAEIHIAEAKTEDALAIADEIEALGEEAATFPIRREIYRVRTLAYLARGDRTNAISAAMSWSRQTTGGQEFTMPILVLARGFKARSQFADATEFFRRVADAYAENIDVMLDYAECLIHSGSYSQAREVLSRLTPVSPSHRRRHDGLSLFLPAQDEVG